MNAIVPIPKVEVDIRPAAPGDLPFIDSLQKKFGKQLGFQANSWIESRIARGEVLIADGAGYIIATDKYMKREELGLVIQLCVDPAKQRALVGAMLVKAAFDRAAYGCRLFCLWCAQDIEANRFWESIGFVPLAFRSGSEKKARVHIFWQKRVRENDTTTPWWYPAKTDAGALRADRLVFPIPPGKHWSDEMPVVLPNEPLAIEKGQRICETGPVAGTVCRPLPSTPKPRAKVHFGARPTASSPENAQPESVKPPKPKRERIKVDPKLVAAARELRDRWLEHVNSGEMLIESSGKYDVARMLPNSPTPALLPAA